MLNDPRMHRALTSTHVPPPETYVIRHDFNTSPLEAGMEARRHSVSSFL